MTRHSSQSPITKHLTTVKYHRRFSPRNRTTLNCNLNSLISSKCICPSGTERGSNMAKKCNSHIRHSQLRAHSARSRIMKFSRVWLGHLLSRSSMIPLVRILVEILQLLEPSMQVEIGGILESVITIMTTIRKHYPFHHLKYK